MATDLSLDAERAMVLVRRLLKEALDASPTADEIVRRWNEDDTTLAGQLFTRSLLEIVPDASPEDRRTLMLHMDQILNRLDAATARERVEIEQERAALAQRRQARAEEEQATRRETVAKLEARLIQLENDVEVERRVRQELETRATVAQPTSAALGSVAPVAVPAPGEAAGIKPAPFPLFSAKEAAYLARSAEPAIGGRSLRGKAVEDIEAAFWLWRGLAGDRPLDTYTREEADDLRRDMLRMLSSYGKGGPKHEMRANYGPRHWIDVADTRQREINRHNASLPEGDPKRKPNVDRMSLRTVKQHYTALSGYWQWLESVKAVPRGSNPFSGWQWHRTRGRRDDRDDWSVEDLNKLLRSSWFDARQRGSDYWWATVIAMFSGMRVEEIARLRAAQDFKEFDGTLCMVLQDQGDWSPKSEAGERVVPVHRLLLELGLRELLERRIAEKTYRLLPGLKKGPRGNLGAYLSKDFSSAKIKLGIGEKTVLHSFRHSIRTQLGNVRGLQETWIDAILGHRPGSGSDSDGRASIGAAVYLKRIGAANLDWAIQQVDYGPEVELWRLGGEAPDAQHEAVVAAPVSA